MNAAEKMNLVNYYTDYFYNKIVEINRVDRLVNPKNFKFKLYTIKELIDIMKDDEIFNYLIPYDQYRANSTTVRYSLSSLVRLEAFVYKTVDGPIFITYRELDSLLMEKKINEYSKFLTERTAIIAILIFALIQIWNYI